MIKKLNIIILLIVLLLPVVVLASAGDIIDHSDNPGGFLPNNIFGAPTSVGGTIIGLLRALLGIVGLIAVAMIIYGGFRYVTAGGNNETTSSAKTTIFNAIIGLVIIILSYVIVTVVTNLAFGHVN